MEQHLSKNQILFLILGVFIFSSLYFFSFWDYGLNLWDEGVPLSGALRISNNEKPCIDFVSYMPFRYYLYFVCLKTSHGAIWGPRVAMAIMGGVISAFIFIIGISIMSLRYALIPALYYLLIPSPYYYRFFTLQLCIVILVPIAMLRTNKLWITILAGAISAVSVWIRQETGDVLLVEVTSIYIYLKWYLNENKTRTKGFIPSMMWVSWLFKIVYWGDISSLLNFYKLIFVQIEESRIYMSLPWPHLWLPSYWIQAVWPFWAHDLTFLILIFLAIYCFNHIWKAGRHNPPFMIAVLISVFSMGLIIYRPGYGNFLRIFPIWMIPMVYVFQSERKDRYQDILHRSFRLIFGIVLVFIAVDSLALHPDRYQSVGIVRTNKLKCNSAILDIQGPQYETSVLNAMDMVLQRMPENVNTLACFPFNPIWNFISGKVNPTFYEWLLPGMIPKRSKMEILKEFMETPPDSIILTDEPFDDFYSRKFSVQYPELFSWIECNYFRWIIIDDFEIFLQVPRNSVEILKEGRDSLIEDVRGISKISWQDLDKKNKMVLCQQGYSKCTFKINGLHHPVLKTNLSVKNSEDTDTIYDEAVRIEIQLVVNGEITSLMCFSDFLSNLGQKEILLDLNLVNETDDFKLVFLSELGDSCEIKWVNPRVFSWPEPKFLR